MIKTITKLLSGLALLSLLVLTACQGPVPAPALNPSVTPFSSPLALPTAAEANSPVASPTPAESALQSTAASVPTPSEPDLSTITGFLMVNKDSPTPAGEVVLYLATIHTDESAKPVVASFDRNTSPRTQTDASGRFVFVDVPSQQYGLIIDWIAEAFLLNTPDDNSDLLFNPKAGEILDIGELVYGSLPKPGALP